MLSHGLVLTINLYSLCLINPLIQSKPPTPCPVMREPKKSPEQYPQCSRIDYNSTLFAPSPHPSLPVTWFSPPGTPIPVSPSPFRHFYPPGFGFSSSPLPLGASTDPSTHYTNHLLYLAAMIISELIRFRSSSLVQCHYTQKRP